MPDRKAQRTARRKLRRKQIKAGLRARRAHVRRIVDEVAELGPVVAGAIQFFRDHDMDPVAVKAVLEGPKPWTFAAPNDDGDGENAKTLSVDQYTRDMLLGLMS